ncbi:MAG: hypothetical protein SFT81_01710 [Candidatus Caenarcaniphilales bacterium]|nr:hypothetical protein [Candidatus Caenarcaniphilales bacterium]
MQILRLLSVSVFVALLGVLVIGGCASSRDQKLRSAYRAAAQWLVKNQRNEGSFIYFYDPKTAQISHESNTVRQLLASQGLARAAKYFNDKELLEAHRKNLKYLLSLIVSSDNFKLVKGDHGAPYVNASAFAVMTLIDSPDRDKYRTLIEQLGAFLLHMQDENGHINFYYPKGLDVMMDEGRQFNSQKFASGESALACIYLYRYLKEPAYLECARRAFSYYYPLIQQNRNSSYASWHGIAYAQLYALEPKPKYLQAINELADILIVNQNTLDNPNFKPGGFDQERTWYTSAEAVFTEALGYAYRSNKAAGNSPELIEKYQQANLLGLNQLVARQYPLEDSQLLAGGIACEDEVPRIYVDNNGHALMAFEEYFSRP